MYSMANEPVGMIMPMLREMRSEMNEQFSRIDARLEWFQQRMDEFEDELKSVRKVLVADTLMSKLVTGDFDKRISVLEIDVQRLMRDT
jgi:predicted nuclease with TOPRIM domain